MMELTDRTAVMVTDVKFVASEQGAMIFRKVKGPILAVWAGDPSDEEILAPEVVDELITARTFVGPTGKRVRLGLSKDVQEVLGLPFGAFEGMSNELEKARNAGVHLLKWKWDVQKMGFWSRLRFLFKGKRALDG